MLGPTSGLLLGAVIASLIASVVVLSVVSHRGARAGCGILIAVLGAAVGLIGVNDHYGYYQNWNALGDDLSGTAPKLPTPSIGQTAGQAAMVSTANFLRGGVVRVVIAGARSGIARPALVYLPAEYYDPKYAHTRFPAVELLHGSPGGPINWLAPLNVATAEDTLLRRHLTGPTVLVMPTMNPPRHYSEGVNGPGGADDTYLSIDVPTWIESHYRVSTDPAQWGIAGYSSGGYAAANLALRHRADFGAAAVLDGYFRAIDGPAAAALGYDPAAEQANSPLEVAQTLPAGTSPLPAFWLSAGTGDKGDFAETEAFLGAMRHLEQVDVAVEPGAGHTFYAWSAALPSVLAWMWQQLAPPDLRHAFPISGDPSAVRVPLVTTPAPKQRHPVKAGNLIAAGPAGQSAQRSAEISSQPSQGQAQRKSR